MFLRCCWNDLPFRSHRAISHLELPRRPWQSTQQGPLHLRRRRALPREAPQLPPPPSCRKMETQADGPGKKGRGRMTCCGLLGGLTDGGASCGVVLEERAGHAGLGSGRARAAAADIANTEGGICRTLMERQPPGTPFPSHSFLPHPG